MKIEEFINLLTSMETEEVVELVQDLRRNREQSMSVQRVQAVKKRSTEKNAISAVKKMSDDEKAILRKKLLEMGTE